MFKTARIVAFVTAAAVIAPSFAMAQMANDMSGGKSMGMSKSKSMMMRNKKKSMMMKKRSGMMKNGGAMGTRGGM